MGKLIEFRDVVKKFNGVPVLDGVTFGVEKGEVLCVVGPSGTGKSVTLKHLVRLLTPTSGQVLVDGVDVAACSDSELVKVRDRILTVSEKMFSHAATKEEAVEDARNHLSLLQEEAQKVIFDDGYAYPVSVSLETSYFTTRSYGNVTLPAGEYQALRVVIGDGGGHNWWCVMFPPLCISAASEEEAQLSDVLSPEQMTLVESDGYEIKFKCVELYEEFRRALSRKSR